jgi:hypothetical protein
VGQQEARIIKRYDFNDYKGRMKTFFKDLGITDNLTGGLLQVDKVIKNENDRKISTKIKRTKTYYRDFLCVEV